MKIRKIVLMAIRGNSDVRKKLKAALGGISEPTFYRMISTNSDNLTKAAALKVIREELGLTDAEILEDSDRNGSTKVAREFQPVNTTLG